MDALIVKMKDWPDQQHIYIGTGHNQVPAELKHIVTSLPMPEMLYRMGNL
jgi:hypothetical protein